MRVAVVIVGFRNPDDVIGCLTALSRQTFQDFEVVVCENGGAKAFAELRGQAPNSLEGAQKVTVFDAGENLGFAGGVNAAIKASAGADAWWVLNPDTQAEPGALAALVERLRLGDCHAIGGVLLREDGAVQGYGGRWSTALAYASSIGWGAPGGSAVDASRIEARQNYLLGASMLVSRTFIERAGLMREDYFLYCEEVEWCLRAGRRGLKLGFAPDARVVHAQGTTTGAGGAANVQSRLSVYLGERNKMLLTRDVSPAAVSTAAAASLAVIFKRYGLVGAWRQLGYGVAGWLAGLRGVRGPPTWAAVARSRT